MTERTTSIGRGWIERFRPIAPWLLVPLVLAAAVAAGMLDDGWRTPRDIVYGAASRSLTPRPWLGMESLSTVIPDWMLAVGFAVPIGIIVWLWKGGRRGIGLFCACTAFSFFMVIELVRLFKPGQSPHPGGPLIAAVIAPVVWWLLRFSPRQPALPLTIRGPWRTRFCTLFWFGLVGGFFAFAVAMVFVVPVAQDLGLTPTLVAAEVPKLREGHTGLIGVAMRDIAWTFDTVGATKFLADANRIDHTGDLTLPARIGASTEFDGVLPDGQLRSVATIEALRQAVDSAAPGDVILLQPGVYRISGSDINFTRPGTEDAPITVRAPQLGSVTLESEMAEALKIDAPYWHFENLVLKGVCNNDAYCDNGFHIVGHAEHVVIHNSRIEDFNAQIKINGENGRFPDGGRIDHSTLIDTHVRQTDASVVAIDLVAANDWSIEDNLIADIVKQGGNAVSYGGYAKGAGNHTVFTRNVVICEWRLRAPGSQSIGLSLGGGGTGPELTRDMGASGNEQVDGVMTDNLIAFCSDDGIYLNRAASSTILHNTLIATSGIDVRYEQSTAHVEANMVDGAIRARNDGSITLNGNESGTAIGMFLGRNPVRAFFEDPSRLDLRWSQLPILVTTAPGNDLCGAEWPALAPPGAFRDYRACVSSPKP